MYITTGNRENGMGRRLVVVALLSGLAGVAGAQDRTGWTRLPNGEWGIMVNYATSGVFQCGRYVPKGSCVAQGNKLSMTNFGNTLTLEFHGVQDAVFASSKVGPQYHPPFSLGTITKTYTGTGPFTPKLGTVPRNYIKFYLSAGFATPFGQVGGDLNARLNAHHGQFHMSGGKGVLEGARIAIDNVSRPDWDYNDFAPVDFTATATVNPEPVTMLMVGSGLVGIGGILRRRRKRQG
jgi:hypothetical protein